MATKQQVTKALAKIGATLWDGGNGIFVIDSPDGMLWHTDTHSILSEWRYDLRQPKADVWASMLEDIEQGVYPCNGWQDGLPESGPCERCTNDGLIG
jgi:hypothetical protein